MGIERGEIGQQPLQRIKSEGRPLKYSQKLGMHKCALLVYYAQQQMPRGHPARQFYHHPPAHQGLLVQQLPYRSVDL